MRWHRSLLLAVALAAAACIGTPQEFQNTGVIVFRNETSVAFVDVRVANCGSQNFGDNRMAGITDVVPGDEFRLRISPGCYDARVGFPDAGRVSFPGIQVREDRTSTVRVNTLPGS